MTGLQRRGAAPGRPGVKLRDRVRLRLMLTTVVISGCGLPERLGVAPARAECSCESPPRVERRADAGTLDHSGPWARISSGERRAGPVVRCAEGAQQFPEGRYQEKAWSFRQSGARLEFWAYGSWGRIEGGVRSSGRSCERAHGTFDGGTILLTGSECEIMGREERVYEGMPPKQLKPSGPDRSRPVRYLLEHEPATGHLVGTRNGAAVRFAPVDFVSGGPPCHLGAVE